jgi:hypothetical protein
MTTENIKIGLPINEKLLKNVTDNRFCFANSGSEHFKKFASQSVEDTGAFKMGKDVTIGVFKMTENDFLYHGSPYLFDEPFLLKHYDNRLTTSINFAKYYATKHYHWEHIGFVYKYRLKKEYIEKYGGIPNMILMNDNYFDGMKKVKEIIKKEKVESLNNNIKLQYKYKINFAHDDNDFINICHTNFNGIYIPCHENQLILCGSTNEIKKEIFLEIDSIYKVKKQEDKFILILYKEF